MEISVWTMDTFLGYLGLHYVLPIKFSDIFTLQSIEEVQSLVHALSLGTWIWLISDLKPYLLLHRCRTFTGPALRRHQTQRNVFVKLKQIFLDWNRNLTFRLLIRSFIWYLICLTNINRKQTILFFKTMDVCQLKHLSKMNLCGDTLFQEWKTEKQTFIHLAGPYLLDPASEASGVLPNLY